MVKYFTIIPDSENNVIIFLNKDFNINKHVRKHSYRKYVFVKILFIKKIKIFDYCEF